MNAATHNTLISRQYASILVAAVLALAVVAAPEPGQAAAAPAEEYCVGHLKPTGADQPSLPMREATLTEQRCFKTFAEAIASATDGAVRVASPDELTEEMRSPPPDAKGPWAIGYDTYIDNGTAKLFIWTVNAPGCTQTDWEIRQLEPPLNDSIIAVQFGGGCNTTCNYDHGGWWGYVQDCKPNCPSLGEMNGRTSSKKWLRRGECPAVRGPK
jgi:hypothetical protein